MRPLAPLPVVCPAAGKTRETTRRLHEGADRRRQDICGFPPEADQSNVIG